VERNLWKTAKRLFAETFVSEAELDKLQSLTTKL